MLNFIKEFWDYIVGKLDIQTIAYVGPEAPLKKDGVCLDLPLYRQVDSFSCGPVAGWTVIKGIYPEANIRNKKAFFKLCRPNPVFGTTTNKLVSALKKTGVGLLVKKNKLSFLEIKKQLNLGFPIIACIQFEGHAEAHWTVVYGYSKNNVYLANNAYSLNPGAKKATIMSYRRFSKIQCCEYLICWGRYASLKS
jgi:hypothetical protein